jgi:hypothetical protein
MFVQEIKRKAMFVNSLFLKKYSQTLSVLQTRSPIGVELVMETTKNLIFQLNFLSNTSISWKIRSSL